MIHAVVFDVGETLVDETRLWAYWADVLGVSPLVLFGVLGAMIERGEDHRRAFEVVRPGFDLAAARRAGAAAAEVVTVADLYADVVPCLTALRAAGYRLGLAGNQPAHVEASLAELDLPVELVAASASWGVEKPAHAFFEAIVTELRLAPQEIAYVGDRLDNDVLPAQRAGMLGVFLHRGPWAYIHASHADAPSPDVRIETLEELPAALRAR